jgi:type IV secretion system protein VirB3
MATAALKGDIVFGALTRPQMFAGVTYSYFVVNAVVTAELFLLTKSFWVLLASLCIHFAGYMACLKEPRIFDLWLTRATRAPRVKNWATWRCNSYRP